MRWVIVTAGHFGVVMTAQIGSVPVILSVSMDVMAQPHVVVTTVSITHTCKRENASAMMDGVVMTVLYGSQNAIQFVKHVQVLQQKNAYTA